MLSFSKKVIVSLSIVTSVALFANANSEVLSTKKRQ